MTRILSDWRFAWFLLLLPVALFLPALPIDETRYLSVAWEMRFTGDALLLHLNGEPYTHKGPLLFWLINLAWTAAGLHVWIVRFGILVCSLISLVLFERLVRRLDSDDIARGGALATRATQIFAGMLFVAVFASLIMFDVLLATCVLVALHGLVDMDEKRWTRGIFVFAFGLSLGMINKGPAMLLDACLVGLIAPWWSATARGAPGRWYAALFVGVAIAVGIGFAYMLLAGGWDFVNAVIFHQTAQRMTQSFAHARPLWWYFMVLPFMILPWTLVLRAPWRVWRDNLAANKAPRFALAWFLPAFVVFCCLSGKQPHYLLPLLPGLALYFAQVLSAPQASVRGRLFGLVLLLAGLVLYATPYLVAHAANLPVLAKLVQNGSISPTEQRAISGLWPLWGALVALIGVFVLVHPRVQREVRGLALATVAAAVCGLLAITQFAGPTVNVTATANRIRAAQEAGKPIAHLGWHHGLFEFPGRLTQPLQKVDLDTLYTWCAAHPEGEVITFYTKYGIPVKPELEVPYRLGRILIWRAADLCAGPHPAHKAVEEDETPND